jgi:hypothetical protein
MHCSAHTFDSFLEIALFSNLQIGYHTVPQHQVAKQDTYQERTRLSYISIPNISPVIWQYSENPSRRAIISAID